MVNGQDLAAFWRVYSDIHDRPHIRDLLEDYRVGSVSEEDAKTCVGPATSAGPAPTVLPLAGGEVCAN